MKVIHIVESLNRGAVENWLVRMLRYGVDRSAALDWTFYCTLAERGALDAEVEKLGARIVYSPIPLKHKLAFMRALRQELRNGGYEVMHCHHDLVSAVYLLSALGVPVRQRIVHAHNADEGVPTSGRLKAMLSRPLMRWMCLAMADRVIGISQHTLETFLSGGQPRPDRDAVHYYGVDPAAFKDAAGDGVAFRHELGLAAESRILLFAGRIVPEKNPLFAVDVLAAMHRRDPRIVGVFVGAGSLETAIRRRVCEHDIGHAFRHLGWRGDIAEVMSCCDCFILPRPENPREGFGLAVVEAQLAGLRLLLSEGIVDDPLLPSAVYRRLPLAAGAEAWAEEGLELIAEATPSRAAALAELEQSPMNMEYAFRHLQELHGSGSIGLFA